MSSNTTLLKSAGVVLIGSALSFIAVFSYLAANFGYPDVLDHDAAQVLPVLRAGGTSLRFVWFLYAALPLGFVYAAAASASRLRLGRPILEKFGVSGGVTAGISMILGLVRWPTIEWALAEHWMNGDPSTRRALGAVFDASNLYLGNFIGEFIGEMGVTVWFVSLALAHHHTRRRIVSSLGFGAGALMFISAFRNMTHAVALVSEINNVTLPLWLIALGVLFYRDGLTTETSE